MAGFYQQAQGIASQLNRLGQNIDLGHMRDEALALENYRKSTEKAIKDQMAALEYMSPKQRIDWYESTDPLKSYQGWLKSIEPTPDNDDYYQAKQYQYGQIAPSVEQSFDQMYQGAKEYHFGNEVSAITSDLMVQGRHDEAREKLDGYVQNGLLKWESAEQIWNSGKKSWALETATRYALDTQNPDFFDGRDVNLGEPPTEPAALDAWNQAKKRQEQAQMALTMLDYKDRQDRQRDTKADVEAAKAADKEFRENRWNEVYNYFSDVVVRKGDLKAGYQTYYQARDNGYFTNDGQAEKMLSELKAKEKELTDSAEGRNAKIDKQKSESVLTQIKAMSASPTAQFSDVQIYAVLAKARADGIITLEDDKKAEAYIKDRMTANPMIEKIMPTAKVWAKKTAKDNPVQEQKLLTSALGYYYNALTTQFQNDYSKITPEWEQNTWRGAVSAATQDAELIKGMLGKTQTVPANRTTAEVVRTDTMQKYYRMVESGELKAQVLSNNQAAKTLQAEMALTIQNVLNKEFSRPESGQSRYFKAGNTTPKSTFFDDTVLSGTSEPVFQYDPVLKSKYDDRSGRINLRLRQNGIEVYSVAENKWTTWEMYCGTIDDLREAAAAAAKRAQKAKK
jgi:hypothetical protein